MRRRGHPKGELWICWQEQIDQIKRFMKRGLTQIEMAKELRVSVNTVRERMREKGWLDPKRVAAGKKGNVTRGL